MTTPNIGLAELANGQSNYINANDAFALLDALVQTPVISKTLTAAPGSPANGALYIMASSWAGVTGAAAGKLALYRTGSGWIVITPKEGWKFECAADEITYRYDGADWLEWSAGGAGGAVADHEALPDPHPQYTTAAEAAAAAPVQTVQGRAGDVVIVKADVGLGSVDNTSDMAKPVSSAQQTALDDKVDKVTGKGLSAEDYTTAEKNKLAALAAVASSGNAADLAVADAGGYYTSGTVEGALQEVGAMIGDIGAALDAINGEVV